MIYSDSSNYAKVWEVKKAEKYIDVRVTTSEKDQNGEWKNSTWFGRVVGKAREQLDDVQPGDNIDIHKCKCSIESYKAKDGTMKTLGRLVIFDAEKSNFGGAKKTVANTANKAANPTSQPMPQEDEEFPF